MRLKIASYAGSIMVMFICVPAVYIAAGTSESQLTNGDSTSKLYEAGFTTMELFDRSRTAREDHDYFGNLINSETARPIQICIWYPALVSEDDLPMMVSEYNFPYPEDTRFIDYIAEIQNREIGYFQRLIGRQESVFDILNDEAGAYRDAAAAEGEFPLIIYIPDAGHGISENFALMEHLAGSGYMAASVHSAGAFQRDPGPDPIDLETVTRDVEFAISSLNDHPHIDINRIGIMGCGFGADAALLLKMRNYDIDAVICLYNEPIEYNRTELLESNPFYDPDRVNIPVLQFARAAGSEYHPGIFDSMVYSTRYMINFLPDSGICLTNYNKYLATVNSPTGGLSAVNSKSFDALHSYTLSFFDAFLRTDEMATSFWSADPPSGNTKPDIMGTKYISAKQAPPTEFQFMNIIDNQGIDTAVELYRRFKPDNPGYLFFREGSINFAGYRFLQLGRISEALTIFKLNTDAYPHSANVWDSYGEACLAAGDYRKALENYRKALEILPADTTTSEALKTAIENGAAQQIERIQELLNQPETEENQ